MNYIHVIALVNYVSEKFWISFTREQSLKNFYRPIAD